MRIHIFAAALVVAHAGAQAADVYRCPDPRGRVLLQQTPCMDGRKLEVKPATGRANQTAAAAARERAAVQREIAVGIGAGKPAIGMTDMQLRLALGEPDRINHGNYQGVVRNQAIYERSDGTWYVYTRNGTVESIQFQNSSRSPQASNKCPSALDIRNLETSASSVTLNPAQRREAKRRVSDARACG